MTTIKAPFNFVPLAKKVYFPQWSNNISMDMPFRDGLSGILELKITACTPIFVSEGKNREDEDNIQNLPCYFSQAPDGRYFIPGTSIKGMVRNIMEIMSCGKMALDKNMRFAQREWNNDKLYTIKETQGKMHCGWLCHDEKGYFIVDCGIPYRIAHTRIDGYLGEKIFDRFCKDSNFDINKEVQIGNKLFDPKQAVYKYKLLEGKKSLENLTFQKDEYYSKEHQESRVLVASSGDINGTIVLTGQPDKWSRERKKNGGKFYEFVFPTATENSRQFELSTDEFKQYEFIYKDSPDWKFLVEDIENKGVPIFFRIENNQIKDWGLALLYKLPYENTPYDTLSADHKKADMDLAECVFGRINEDTKDALKGRVHFSHAFSENAQLSDSVCLTLNSPKASYYPLYVKQSTGNNVTGKVISYNTYNDGEIAGWKRYVVRAKAFEHSVGDSKIDTTINPLKENTTFTCKVRFHNLKRVELGALLSAITFHNTPNCFHQIGQGKPYGFGKVSVDLFNYPSELPPLEELLKEYEREMFLHNDQEDWTKTETMKQLITLAHSEVTVDEIFDYMHLDMESKNDFEYTKEAKEFLRLYTYLTNQIYTAKSLYGYEDVLQETKPIWEEYVSLLENKQLDQARVQLEKWYELTQETVVYHYELQKIELARKEMIIEKASALKYEFEHCITRKDFSTASKLLEQCFTITQDDALRLEMQSLLNKAILNAEQGSKPLAEQLTLSSAGAFEGSLKKIRKGQEGAEFTDEQLTEIKKCLIEHAAEITKWKDIKKKIKDIEKHLGKELIQEIFA